MAVTGIAAYTASIGSGCSPHGSMPFPVTGKSMLLTKVSVKELEILRETLPEATRIGLPWNPTSLHTRPLSKPLKALPTSSEFT